MGKTVTLATCTLNQWAMDFKGNLARISESKNCRSLPFPELGPNKQVIDLYSKFCRYFFQMQYLSILRDSRR